MLPYVQQIESGTKILTWQLFISHSWFYPGYISILYRKRLEAPATNCFAREEIKLQAYWPRGFLPPCRSCLTPPRERRPRWKGRMSDLLDTAGALLFHLVSLSHASSQIDVLCLTVHQPNTHAHAHSQVRQMICFTACLQVTTGNLILRPSHNHFFESRPSGENSPWFTAGPKIWLMGVGLSQKKHFISSLLSDSPIW